jgi:hypothetical protein
MRRRQHIGLAVDGEADVAYQRLIEDGVYDIAIERTALGVTGKSGAWGGLHGECSLPVQWPTRKSQFHQND